MSESESDALDYFGVLLAVICWGLLVGLILIESPLQDWPYIACVPILSLFSIVIISVAVRRRQSTAGQVALFFTIVHLGVSSYLAVLCWGFSGM